MTGIQCGAAPHTPMIRTYGFLQVLSGGVNSLWSTAILSTQQNQFTQRDRPTAAWTVLPSLVPRHSVRVPGNEANCYPASFPGTRYGCLGTRLTATQLVCSDLGMEGSNVEQNTRLQWRIVYI